MNAPGYAVSDERDELNRVLHMGATPCRTACTHVICGQWTALGAANMLSRATDATADAAAARADRGVWKKAATDLGTELAAERERADKAEALLRGWLAWWDDEDAIEGVDAPSDLTRAFLSGADS